MAYSLLASNILICFQASYIHACDNVTAEQLFILVNVTGAAIIDQVGTN